MSHFSSRKIPSNIHVSLERCTYHEVIGETKQLKHARSHYEFDGARREEQSRIERAFTIHSRLSTNFSRSSNWLDKVNSHWSDWIVLRWWGHYVQNHQRTWGVGLAVGPGTGQKWIVSIHICRSLVRVYFDMFNTFRRQVVIKYYILTKWLSGI